MWPRCKAGYVSAEDMAPASPPTQVTRSASRGRVGITCMCWFSESPGLSPTPRSMPCPADYQFGRGSLHPSSWSSKEWQSHRAGEQASKREPDPIPRDKSAKTAVLVPCSFARMICIKVS